MLTKDELSGVMPRLAKAKRDLYFPHLTAAMTEFGISSYLREAAFLAQLAHESAQLRYLEEIASGAAYEGRRDLGNVQRGDGRRYKGRGPIQLTGRANYRKYGQLLGIDLEDDPERAAAPEVGFRTAGLYWQSHGLNELADERRFQLITRRINGGLNGLDDREAHYHRALAVLSPNDPPASVVLDDDATTISVKVDGILVVLEGDPTIGVLHQGSVWAPLRPLAEHLSLGIADVRGDVADLVRMEGKPGQVPVALWGNRGFAPVKAVAMFAGRLVSWDAEAREVSC